MPAALDHRVAAAASRTAGSSLLVAVAMIAIFVAAAAAVAPGLVGVLEFERVERAAVTLATYERALARFKTDVSAYPGTLEQVTRQIVAADVNSCGGGYNNQQLKDDGSVWIGPYLTRVVPGHGELPLEIGAARNQLRREPTTAQNNNSPGELIVEVVDTDLTAARALDVRIDGVADGGAGKVRWGVVDVDGFVTVEYRMAVTGC